MMLSFKQFILEMPVLYPNISGDSLDRARPFPKKQITSPPGKEVKITDPEIKSAGYKLFHHYNETGSYTDAYFMYHAPSKSIHYRVMGYRDGDTFTDSLVQKHPTAKVGINMGHVYKAILDHNSKVITDNIHSVGMKSSFEKHVATRPDLDITAHHYSNPVGKVTSKNADDFYTHKNSEEPGNEHEVGEAIRFHLTNKKKQSLSLDKLSKRYK